MIDFTVTEVFFSENIPSMKKLTIKFIISFYVHVYFFFIFWFPFLMLPFFTTNPATVLTPSGKTHYPKIEDNKDGTVTIRYQPTESGLHELDVRYNKEPIQGTMDDLRNFNYAKSKKQNQMLSDV